VLKPSTKRVLLGAFVDLLQEYILDEVQFDTGSGYLLLPSECLELRLVIKWPQSCLLGRLRIVKAFTSVKLILNCFLVTLSAIEQ